MEESNKNRKELMDRDNNVATSGGEGQWVEMEEEGICVTCDVGFCSATSVLEFGKGTIQSQEL